MIYSREELGKRYESGEKLKYLFFWGHQPSKDGSITSSCFSQWWESPFEVNGVTYRTAEHWMMAEKARLFDDKIALASILGVQTPSEAKKWGRRVKNFVQDVWEDKRIEIVIEGNYHKFIQNKDLKDYLIGTKNRILVEASPVDSVWGIGMTSNDEFAYIPTKWKGHNLLGFALMNVRDRLMTSNIIASE
ncbi:MAG: NADAR family protein [Ekhidna sp.]|nr:NADAR family protein [Ekhidna sp.]